MAHRPQVPHLWFNPCNNPVNKICYYPHLQRGRERLSNIFKVTPPVRGWTKAIWLQNLLSQPLTLPLCFVRRRNKKGEIGNAKEKNIMERILGGGKRWYTKDTDGRKRSGNITSSPQDRRKDFKAGLEEIWWFCRWSYPRKFNSNTVARNSQLELRECLINFTCLVLIFLAWTIITTPPNFGCF